jgi:hypothetical protein
MGGQLRLQTWDSTVRSIHLNIPEIKNSGCPYGWFEHANLVTLGEDDDNNGFLTEPQLDPGVGGDRLNLLDMEVESSTKAGLRILFPLLDPKKGNAWYVLFGGVETADPAQPNLVTVTAYDTDNDGKPDKWTIEADADDQAALVRIDQEPRPRVPCTFVSMPFKITVEILP